MRLASGCTEPRTALDRYLARHSQRSINYTQCARAQWEYLHLLLQEWSEVLVPDGWGWSGSGGRVREFGACVERRSPVKIVTTSQDLTQPGTT